MDSLINKEKELSFQNRQLEILNGGTFLSGELPTFEQTIEEINQYPLKPKNLEVLQVNLGYLCNQTCNHCHVNAGPNREEIMDISTLGHILEILRKTKVGTLDLTGGAPEMNPHFRWFVAEARKSGVKDFIVRSNLTIILEDPVYSDLPEFFAKYNIHLVSSLPFYKKERTDKQRGDGVFDKSIKVLQMLNKAGYGKENSKLKLDLVYNPAGAFLPANQDDLEKEFKNNLKSDYNIDFNTLFALTNLPISRFLNNLIKTENYEGYMQTLVEAYNPTAVTNVMCRNTISVGWNGYIYDCDFNQMLGLGVASKVKHISQFNEELLQDREIIVSQHCYGCVAGAGSSCQGTIA